VRCGRPIQVGVLALAIGMVFADSASAHTRSQSFSSWRIQNGQVRLTFTIQSLEASRLLLVEGGFPDIDAQLIAHVTPRIAIASDGKACPSVGEPRVLRAREGYLRVVWRFTCPPDVLIEITNDAFFELASSHVHYARVRAGDSPPVEYLFTDAERRHVITANEEAQAASPGASFGSYVTLGIEHILVGLDHIAFLLALLLLCRRVREIIFMVTGFTLGHSITLGIAVLGLVEPNVPIIEALIGFTIALVAAENVGVTAHASRAIAVIGGAGLAALALLRLIGGIGLPPVTLFGLALFTACYLSLSNTRETAARLRPALTVLFGLIHGFGFASVLIEIGLPAHRLASALFGFNLGVEIGQLGIVAGLGLLGTLVTRRFAAPDYRLAVDGTSAALCGLGLFWFVQRAYLV